MTGDEMKNEAGTDTPGMVRLTDGLGLVPARCNAGTARFAHNDATPLWTEAEVRQMLAAERERWTEAVMGELDGNGQAHAIVAYATRA